MTRKILLSLATLLPLVWARNYLRSPLDTGLERRRRTLEVEEYWTPDRIKGAIAREVVVEDLNGERDDTALTPLEIAVNDGFKDGFFDDDEDDDDEEEENDDDNDFHSKFMSFNGRIVTMRLKEEEGEEPEQPHHHRQLALPVSTIISPMANATVQDTTLSFVFNVAADKDTNMRKTIFFLKSPDGFWLRQRFWTKKNRRYTVTVGPLEAGEYQWGVKTVDQRRRKNGPYFQSFQLDKPDVPDTSNIEIRNQSPSGSGAAFHGLSTFTWSLTGATVDSATLRQLYLMFTSPSGMQSFLPIDVSTSQDYEVSVILNEIGKWEYAVWLEGESGIFLQGPWTSFTLHSTVRVPPASTLCSEPLGHWVDRDSNLHKAVGRLLFRFGNKNYVCTGTLVKGAHDRAIIATAGHCIVDDQGAFPDKVMFVPGQDDGGKDGSDWSCKNDAHGCFFPEIGVVSRLYQRTGLHQFDYGFYVAPDDNPGPLVAPTDDIIDAHGSEHMPENRHDALVPMDISFSSPHERAKVHLFGYPLNRDGKFMYSAGRLESSPYSSGGYYQRCSSLRHGASGGPWTTSDPTTGNIVVQTVSSWARADARPGVGAPPFGSAAKCVYDAANQATLGGAQNVVANC